MAIWLVYVESDGQVKRGFVYDAGQRMVEHQLPTGLRCFYQWALVEDREWRVVRHWTDAGDTYDYHYELDAGITRITDGLERISIPPMGSTASDHRVYRCARTYLGLPME